MSRTKIAWADSTINPVVGCSKISEGCQNCYAENMAARLASMGLGQYQSVTSFRRWNGLTVFVPSELAKPHGWRKPRTVFVSSMGDLFHKSAQFEWFEQVMRTVMELPRHTFIFLTKRPERMGEWLAQYPIVLHNLVIGVSVEDQQAADERIPVLLQIPAAKRFISLEPMIEAVDLYRGGFSFLHSLKSPQGKKYPALDGVILGGESGSKGRRLNPQWVMTVRDQCAAAGVPFMFKQWNHENRNEVDPETGFPWLGDRTHSELAW